jgi:CrcB protein
MISYFWVTLGGAIGSAARFWISGLVASQAGESFPFGTMVVNVTGSFLIGLLAAWSGPDSRFLTSPAFREFFMIGICGGYTTFSSFSLQTLFLAQEGEWFRACAYVVASFALCMVAVSFGYFTLSLINKP